jgi:rhamnosyltransferase
VAIDQNLSPQERSILRQRIGRAVIKSRKLIILTYCNYSHGWVYEPINRNQELFSSMTKRINNQRQPKVCAVVTTFRLDEGFPDRIARIQAQVESVVIVDDGASIESKARLKRWFDGMHPGIVLLHHVSNRGVAAALNTGLEWAGARGFTYAALFDDDGLIAPGMVGRLVAAFDNDLNQMRAIVGISYSAPSKEGSQEGASEQLKKVSTVITAGSMIPLKIFQHVGPFREELFIDYVDHEYCLRARLRGVWIRQCAEVGMVQPIGQRQKTAWGELRSVHSPARTYYFFRNSLAIAREYFWRFPGFTIWIGWQQFKTLVKIIFFMQPKRLYWSAMIRGWADGWAGRFGRISDDIIVMP